MPIPLINDGGKWRFDTAAGKQELLYRRIGHNELGAIAACRGYIDAQKDYAAVGHDDLLPGIYAQKLMSSPGKQDGLYWKTNDNEPPSPIGVMTFIIDQNGVVYQKDLGEKTAEIANSMTEYNPDHTWRRVTD